MEEILASIRKIIAEEKATPRSDSAQVPEPQAAPQMAEAAPVPVQPAPDPGPGMPPAAAEPAHRPADNGATPPAADDVLELTEIVGEDGSVATIEATSPPSEATPAAPLVDVTPDVAVGGFMDAADKAEAAPAPQAQLAAEPSPEDAAPVTLMPEQAAPAVPSEPAAAATAPTVEAAVRTIPDPEPQSASPAEAEATAQQVESILFGDPAPAAAEPSATPEPEAAPEPQPVLASEPVPEPVDVTPAAAEAPQAAEPSGPPPSAALSELAGGDQPDAAAGDPGAANLPATQQDLSKDLQRLVEAMSPVFRQWLDKNLPTLIEEVVERVADKKDPNDPNK